MSHDGNTELRGNNTVVYVKLIMYLLASERQALARHNMLVYNLSRVTSSSYALSMVYARHHNLYMLSGYNMHTSYFRLALSTSHTLELLPCVSVDGRDMRSSTTPWSGLPVRGRYHLASM